MGLINTVFSMLFGGGRNIVRETAEVFRENAEAGAQRATNLQGQALSQHAAEFAQPRQGGFDRFMDGLNRLPRPAMAIGILGLFVSSMVDPIWFASRMQGLVLVPEPLWWLLGVIVSFYFGARHQVKSYQFQQSLTDTMVRVPQVLSNLEELRHLAPTSPGVARAKPEEASEALTPDANAALSAWRMAKA
ncbi:holin family protein [Falsihalocynthiibacter sp. S25ZX9]|uniref:holin family protein n=1 Tax=Falsihalocynthiibacter sp. S25ZX9 TaxID=3240870 RepID=UPI00350F37F7